MIVTRRTNTFTDLVVWQKAHALVLCIYRATSAFPPEEKYGLSSQMRRAAVSVPANIAEGFKRRGRLDTARFLNIAQGSNEENRYYLMLMNDLGYGESASLLLQLDEVGRLLSGYREAIMRSST